MIGFGVYSLHSGILQVGRHEVAQLSRVETPGMFWVATSGLIVAGIVFITRGMKSES